MVQALESVVNIDGADVADIGCGTGQLAKRIGARVNSYHGFDLSAAMIEAARRNSGTAASAASVGRIRFEVADAFAIPLPDSAVDLTVYPWSMTSIVAPGWPEHWRERLEEALAEAHRMTRPGGALAVIETASLAGELPWGEVWHPIRRAFLSELERVHCFDRVLFANDWEFRTRGNARRYAPLWFDRRTINTMLRARCTLLTECSGIWWREVRGD